MKFFHFLLITFVILTYVIAEDCGGSVADCYIKAKALLDQDRKEMRNTIDKLIAIVEDYKKSITESTRKEINNITAPIGTIVYHSISKEIIDGNSDLPQGWSICDGRALLKKDYPELFAIIGVTYGEGDGSNSFNLPDLRGRVIVASGQGNNLSYYNPGKKGGEEFHTLSVDEMPSHQHMQGGESIYNDFGGGNRIARRTYPEGPHEAFRNQLTSATGGNNPHNNMQPYIAHHAIIRVK